MKRGKKEKSGKRVIKALALSQIFIFIISSFAFAFIFGGMVVSAAISPIIEPGKYFYYNGNYYKSNTATFSMDTSETGSAEILKNYVTSQTSSGKITKLNSPPTDVVAVLSLSPANDGTITQSVFQNPDLSKNIPTSANEIPSTISSNTLVNVKYADHTVVYNSATGQYADYPAGSNTPSTTGTGETNFRKYVQNFNFPTEVTTGSTSTSTDLMAASQQEIELAKKDMANPLVGANIQNSQAMLDQAEKGLATSQSKILNAGAHMSAAQAELAQAQKEYEKGTTFADAVAAAKLDATPGAERKYTNIFGKDATYTTGTWGALGANLGEGLKWSLIIIGVVETLGKTFLSEKNFAMVRAAEQAAVAGIMTYKSVYGLFEKFGGKQMIDGKVVQGADTTHLGLSGSTWAIGVGILVAYLAFASQYKKEKQQEASIEFKCMPWQAPRGGSDCNKCNGNALQPCSEYRCKSLGQNCILINKGTGQDRCIDSSPSDVTSPGIKPDTTILTQGYKYTDRQDRPPGGEGPAHVRITSSSGGCLKAFTAFEFGIITTDTGDVTQPAQCKLDYNHTVNFDAMNYYMDDNNLFIENHSQAVSLPGTDLLNKTFPGVKNDGEYTLYVRCKDGNGNENRDEYAVRFCIDKTPDLSSPVINSISVPSGSPVLYGVDNLSIGVYTNEPSNCRWSRKDASYSNMENQFTCSNNVWEMNAELLYTCNAKLTGIKDKEENNFYFRCTDLSNNTMQQSYNYKLIGTQPINILTVGPSGTIGSSTTTATVSLTAKTDNGYKNGESICYYSQTNLDKDYVAMFETGTSIHKQDLDLVGGNYKYYFKCVDAGGNTAYNNTNFTVFVDKFAPAIVRAYLLESKLIVTTDEDSTCSYSTTSCNFNINEGVNMPIDSTMNHYADMKTEQTYYVKCKDKFNNEPDPTQCSMVIQPYSLVDLTI
jgi:hypothetical protein